MTAPTSLDSATLPHRGSSSSPAASPRVAQAPGAEAKESKLELVSRFVLDRLPRKVRRQVETYLEALDLCLHVDNPRVLLGLSGSGFRGLFLQRGKTRVSADIASHHQVHFDWSYPSDNAEMRALYERAKRNQWRADELPWDTDVDPMRPETSILPPTFLDPSALRPYGIRLDAREKQRFIHSIATWNISQFLHGEQGALYAAAQVTEAIEIFDGKLYGATQVMDEGRHIEVFRRYLTDKMQKVYPINDNLYTLLDALVSDSRWDLKFMGMQIMVEGLALGAFGSFYRQTREPLLKELLRYVIRDEVRHVHYGVVALRGHIKEALSERERNEREDWCFEVTRLMRDRMMAYEVYEEWFEGLMRRSDWRTFFSRSAGNTEFRRVMLSRLIPNLRAIGLLSARIRPRYLAEGLLEYESGPSGDKLSTERLFSELDRPGTA